MGGLGSWVLGSLGWPAAYYRLLVVTRLALGCAATRHISYFKANETPMPAPQMQDRVSLLLDELTSLSPIFMKGTAQPRVITAETSDRLWSSKLISLSFVPFILYGLESFRFMILPWAKVPRILWEKNGCISVRECDGEWRIPRRLTRGKMKHLYFSKTGEN